MREVGQILKWLEHRTREFEHSKSGCGLILCAGPKSPWARLWKKRSGALLQGEFYCQRECLEIALTAQLARLHALNPAPPPSNRIPLGLLMVARGWLTHEQVVKALAAQEKARTGQIGDWFERLGFATEQQVTSALALQWGCPVTSSLDSAAIQPFDRIPLGILEAFQMIPVHFVRATNTVYIAFGQRVDHAALYAIEKILGCRTQPCVAGRRHVADELVRMRQQPRPRELAFGPMRDFAEIGRVSVSYMLKLGAEDATLGRVGDFIWLRVRVRNAHTDVVFRLESRVRAAKSAVGLGYSSTDASEIALIG
ncbi:MAG: hypothetical protein HY010_13550 [Acidobacteria bacterium]|nr:hypothetical protein [Acidobacteriota bacterium]